MSGTTGLGVKSCIKVNRCYQIHEKLGRGSVSKVYRVQDLNSVYFAAKFVSRRHGHLLENETNVMQKADGSREEGTLYWHYHGRYGNKHVLVMDFLGSSLWSLRHRLGTMSIKAALVVRIQMTTRLEALHERGFIQCNINPEHVFVGHDSGRNSVYLTSYGHAKKYRDENGNHKPLAIGIPFRGSKDFVPRQAHRGEEQSRRSNLESAIYTIIYLIRGLPWKNQRQKDLLGAAHMKENISAEELCSNLPAEILMFYFEVKDLVYFECPDHASLRGHLQSALHRNGYDVDDAYDLNV